MTGWRGQARRELSQRLNRTGYPVVRLTVDGRYKEHPVHLLVLLAFAGPRPEGKVTRHLNGVPTDNRLGNLRWGTPKENTADMFRHGRFRGGRSRALKEGEIAEVVARRSAGERLSVLAEAFGMSEASISRIARGKQFVCKTCGKTPTKKEGQ